MNATPSASRVHIAIFGRRNAGKSSVINAITGQNLAIVSPEKGTTTDPVYKSMELLPLGPVVIIDTPGIDDTGELGLQRVQKSHQVMGKADIALLVVDAALGLTDDDMALIARFDEKKLPYIVAYNKTDLPHIPIPGDAHSIAVSARTGENISALKEKLAQMAPALAPARPLIGDLVSPGDVVVLVVPIDSAAPKGRLILPQQQVIRDLLDHQAMAIITQPAQLPQTLANLAVPAKMVVTDSQAFAQVAPMVPESIPLTSFSILFARFKGDLEQTLRGAKTVDTLQDEDHLLIVEGCTHHRQCDDIGTVKIPGFLQQYTGKKLQFSFCSGGDFPDELSSYALVIHCGGCMLNSREMASRLARAAAQGVPITNYGMVIAQTKGILPRSMALFANP